MAHHQRTLRTIGLLTAALSISVVSATFGGDVIDQDQPWLDAQPTWGPDMFGGYVTDYILVRAAPGVVPVELADGRVSFAAGELQGPVFGVMGEQIDELADAIGAWGVTDIEIALSVEPANRELAAELGLDRYYKVYVPAGSDTQGMVEAFNRFPTVLELAELDGIGGVAATTPNDSSFGQLYGMHNTGQNIQGQNGVADADMDAPEAWDLHTGSDTITLAVIDSGVDPHNDLASKMVPGWNTNNNSSDTSDIINHGTHVAGTAAAKGDNNYGVVGVNWLCKIMPIRVLNSGGGGTESNCADGIIWAADHGADVGTMSLQYYSGTSYFFNGVLYGYNQGMTLVAATGNNQGAIVAFPARWSQTIAVGATDNRDIRPGFSNYGPQIDVVAAGVNVLSTVNTTQFSYYSGTSMATPHVSGLVCLLRSHNPDLSNVEIRDILRNTAEDKGSNGFDNFYGYGRVNAFDALVAAGGGGGGDPEEAPLVSHNTVVGTRLIGGLSRLRESDGRRYKILSEFLPQLKKHRTTLLVNMDSPFPTVSSLRITLQHHVTQRRVTTRVNLKNWVTNKFDQIEIHTTPISDTEYILDVDNPTDYVRESDGRIRFRMITNATIVFNPRGYIHKIDHIQIDVTD